MLSSASLSVVLAHQRNELNSCSAQFLFTNYANSIPPSLKPTVPFERLAPGLAITAAELPGVDDVVGAKVAVQVRAPVGALGLVPLDGPAAVKGREPDLDDPEAGRVLEEEVCCDGDLEYLCVCFLC